MKNGELVMTTKKITPEIVKKIELSLEERKVKKDRRKADAASAKPPFDGSDRRSGRERRGPNE
jgi:hypothetical protein